MVSQRLSEAEMEQRVIHNAEKKAINKAVAEALKGGNGEARSRYYEGLLAGKRQLTIESQKSLLAFMKKYYQEHYYFSSRKLAKIYGDQRYGEAPPISLVLAFSRIIKDLKDLGAIERHNTQVYRKVINPEMY